MRQGKARQGKAKQAKQQGDSCAEPEKEDRLTIYGSIHTSYLMLTLGSGVNTINREANSGQYLNPETGKGEATVPCTDPYSTVNTFVARFGIVRVTACLPREWKGFHS